MSYIGEAFIETIGRPDPSVPAGISFSGPLSEMLWADLFPEVGAGYYRDRFMYLFGQGLQDLAPCLEAWSFLVPPDGTDRMIVGRNAHGFLLVLENPNGKYPSVCVLDPVKLDYWTDQLFDFSRLIGFWLGGNNLHEFLDAEVYEAWRLKSGRHLAPDEILGIKVPVSLGGQRTLENFELQNIRSYYENTGPHHAKAFAQMGRPVPAVRPVKGESRPGKQGKKR